MGRCWTGLGPARPVRVANTTGQPRIVEARSGSPGHAHATRLAHTPPVPFACHVSPVLPGASLTVGRASPGAFQRRSRRTRCLVPGPHLPSHSTRTTTTSSLPSCLPAEERDPRRNSLSLTPRATRPPYPDHAPPACNITLPAVTPHTPRPPFFSPSPVRAGHLRGAARTISLLCARVSYPESRISACPEIHILSHFHMGESSRISAPRCCFLYLLICPQPHQS